MNTEDVFFIGPDDSEDFPRIDFSCPENRHYDWLSVGEMIDGSRKPDTSLLSSINIKVSTRRQFDCLSFSAKLLVSDAAREVFEKEVPRDCNFVSLRVNRQRFHILLAHNIVDALDKAKSELQYFAKDPKRVMLIRKYCFKKTMIPDPSLFRIPENVIRIFVTDTVKNAIEYSKLAGFQIIDFEKPPPDVYVS
jgi:hypothetical protein